ncbi:MAG TPA: hypothetical protein VFV71_07890 [Burkholderiales bacterium]|nr:hypothetical protein [Burkholderiales bacterium]
MLAWMAATAWAGNDPVPAKMAESVAGDVSGTQAGDDEGAVDHGAQYQGPDEIVMNDEEGERTEPSPDAADASTAVDEPGDGGNATQAVPDADEAVQASVLQKFIALTGDKIVVILPKGWGGSVPDLLAALEDASDDAEIVVLSHKGERVQPAPPGVDDDDDDEGNDDD